MAESFVTLGIGSAPGDIIPFLLMGLNENPAAPVVQSQTISFGTLGFDGSTRVRASHRASTGAVALRGSTGRLKAPEK